LRCKVYGKLTSSAGQSFLASGWRSSGKVCRICPPYFLEESCLAEAISFNGDGTVILSPLDRNGKISPGWWVVQEEEAGVPVGNFLLGRVLDGAGRPIDGGTPLDGCEKAAFEENTVPPLARPLICNPLPTGVRAIDALLTCGHGQRIGIFAGSGVGKSTLLGMIVRNTEADKCVVTLVGERGRELREFTDRVLGREGMARTVVVAATADAPALMRARAVKTSAVIAEWFRDQGNHVVWIIDSVTRLAHALREVGLASGEPPATRGYPPSVFSKLAELMERAGPSQRGSITLFCTVLVEGDDLTEPVSDSVRSVLDGHIVLSRSLAGRGHYPAIDVLESVSRLMPDIVDEEHMSAAREAREILAAYKSVEDLIAVGAYTPGNNPRYDNARAKINSLMEFLRQDVTEKAPFNESRERLKELVFECGT